MRWSRLDLCAGTSMGAGGLQRQASPTPPLHHTELKSTLIYAKLLKQLFHKRQPRVGVGWGGVGGGYDIRENMCNAKNNHCVMRKQNEAASGASTGYMQEGGGRNSPGSVVRHSG